MLSKIIRQNDLVESYKVLFGLRIITVVEVLK